MGSYDRFPTVPVPGHEVLLGYGALLAALARRVDELRAAGPSRVVVSCECYPGVREDELLDVLRGLRPDVLLDTRELFPEPAELTRRMAPFLTDDRVFGRMCFGELEDFMDADALAAARERVASAEGLVVVCGFGATLVHPGDVLVYADVTRWEIQLRYRAGMPNYGCDNAGEDVLRKVKRGYFVEWRLADRVKARVLPRADFVVDTVEAGAPRAVTGEALQDALDVAASRPFRTVPYFDPGVWGGQWMRERFGLPDDAPNYAWAFDGVPEENALALAFDNAVVRVPAMDLTLLCPLPLLGEGVYARYGAEFPIRFDFLDTMGGQNLSLQVHPTTDYIRRAFGMAYTQDESYYILDAGEDACVYLGLREGVDPAEVMGALEEANAGGEPFDASRYVNRIPARRHDHFLIPAGTIHGAGANTMVLEISATPYIFTFKLWDWGRLGLDGRPRPVHLEHGREVIRWDRTTGWVEKSLVDQAADVDEPCGAARVERTGLHALEPLETRRYTVGPGGRALLDTAGTVNVLNLVEGEEVLVESPEGAFEPMRVHYAETFVVPAATGAFAIRNDGRSTAMLMRAHVRGTEER
ncbi:class I mannose-6-phosphate isomerase [Olsenella sp. An293]|uniref:class I mannose-6-phosphate isomerase n=1 Tax=Olsenella sp. An293 TaxID=1965626 RepID=UPI000B392DE3|nr:class I mannose-6-phosphate isomerase [Olsenella sp. An293]OUO32412.1 mannose-6-phosphate isomerase [Olsenella sp. An293]